MAQVLYRKYRSKKFDEVVGQEHITITLSKAIKNERVSHAYLFVGPRGIGKTSVARILAHEVNKLPYNDESLHLDIIEIDAASNRRIDEIRDLREKVHITPSSARYKVYIIDEVHMLTREAFNALLKTLEEPPPHCIFILATTELQKLPETIISRTQRFNFKPPEPKQISNLVESIAKKEKIKISPEALDLIAEHSHGSFRDAISLLDQLSAAGTLIDERTVRKMMGMPHSDTVKELVYTVAAGDSQKCVDLIDSLQEGGSSPGSIASAMAQELRREVLKNPGSRWALKLMRRLMVVASSSNPHDILEISILEAAGRKTASQTTNFENPPPTAVVSEARLETSDGPIARGSSKLPSAKDLPDTSEFIEQSWPAVILKIKSEAAFLYGALRLAVPTLKGNVLTLTFRFPLHSKKIYQLKNRELLEKIIKTATGQKLLIKCELDKNLAADSVLAFENTYREGTDNNQASSEPPSQVISNIFGNVELLDS